MLIHETAIRKTIQHQLTLGEKVWGVQVEVFEQQLRSSVLGRADQNSGHYRSTPDFSGRRLVTGLNQIRHGIKDKWSPGVNQLRLWWSPIDSEYVPKEQAKIRIEDNDNIIVAKILTKKEITGQRKGLIYVFELIPLN